MNRLKALTFIGIIGILSIIINACCDGGGYYKWHNIIMQSFSNGQLADSNTISQTGFSIRVNLINTKSEHAYNYLPDFCDKAFASDCAGDYKNIDVVEDIDILFLTENNGNEIPNIVTFQFVAKTDLEVSDEYFVLDFTEVLNGEDAKLIEYFDLVLKQPFDESVSGRIVLQLRLADERILSDTTETLNLIL